MSRDRRNSSISLAVSGAIFLAAVAPALAGRVVDVTVRTIGDNTSQITLHTAIQAPRESVWQHLTDYNHHAGFLPYLTRSRIVAGRPPFLQVEQEGVIRILFWSFTLRVIQTIAEEPPHRMRFRAIDGDFARLEGQFDLSRTSGTPLRTTLDCSFTVKPKRPAPDWAVRIAARRYLRKMVHVLAVAAESHRI